MSFDVTSQKEQRWDGIELHFRWCVHGMHIGSAIIILSPCLCSDKCDVNLVSLVVARALGVLYCGAYYSTRTFRSITASCVFVCSRLAMVLEWKQRSTYVLTELVTFLLICIVLLVTAAITVTVIFLHLKKKTSFFIILRPLFECVFTTAIDFSRADEGKLVRVVFLGYKEQKKHSLVRVWVHVYFTILCSIIMLWSISVFSDTILYRKTSTCLDLSVRDTDSSCFLLSDENIPREIQEIIDEEEGNVVPCQRVQNYILLANITYDLEVICYQSQLSPLAAVGVAYGATKAIVFAVVTILSIFFSVSGKLHARFPSKCFIYVAQAGQIGLSVLVIGIIVVVVSCLHTASDTRNTSFDYLRGEQFYNLSVIVLTAITILWVFGLFPWWAFKPLKERFSSRDDGELCESIHNMILKHKFSSVYNEDDEEGTTADQKIATELVS